MIIFFLIFPLLLNSEELPAWGIQLEGFPLSPTRVQDEETRAEVPISAVGFYLQWDEKQVALLETLEAISGQGAVPMISWEPKGISAEAILLGKYDSYLTQVANEISRFQNSVWIRFAHEMNLQSYHWGSDREGFGEKSPTLYKQMWRYIVTFFRNRGVKNVLWVFCPNADSVPAAPWNRASAFFPGSDVVDLFAMDGYDFGPPDANPRSFEETFSPLYEELKSLDPRIAIIIGETATYLKGPARKEWIQKARAQCRKWGVSPFFWFQVNKERDWSLP